MAQMDLFTPAEKCASSNSYWRNTGAENVCASSGSPKGNRTGAKCAPVRHTTGAPLVRLPSRALPNATGARRVSDEEKIIELRSSMKDASLERAALMPNVDSYRAALANARANLKASHERADVLDPAERVFRIGQHNAILEAATRWGKDMNAYKALNSSIDNMQKAIAAIIKKKGDKQ